MDKITNNILNNVNNNVSKDNVSKGIANIDSIGKSPSVIKPIIKENVVDINDAKMISADLAKSAPIDTDKVAKIKAAISAGHYPLDLDKLSDALMQAYREMKS
jgi:negative regulator of flagellin synthesis FlgM